MTFRASTKWFICIICLILSLFASGCNTSTENGIPHPPEAIAIPDFSGEITDVRIQTVTCESYKLDLSQYTNFKGKTLLQIEYGYQSDGEWFDIPCENYELKGIFENEGTSGKDAVPNSHLVKIGPYLLICHVLYSNAPNSECIISDSLGTTVQKPFMDYFTPFIKTDDQPGYALLTVDRDSIVDGKELSFTAYGVFGKYYYLILKIDEIPDDYELRITDHTWSESYNNNTEHVLSMSDILNLVDLYD